MQQRALLVLAFGVASAGASAVSAASTASEWLQKHQTPTDDQLGELKNANPDAYAMVKALLTKHSMGLVKLAPEQRGPDVFRNMMTPSHLAAHRPQAYMGASTPVDNMKYNPKAAADKDEQMVDKLLGAVAGLSGAKGKKIALLRKRHHKEEVESPFANDMAAFGVAAQTTMAPAAQPEEAPQVEEQQQPDKHENSYLKGIDLTGDMPSVAPKKHAHAHDPNNYLATFSFGDDAPPVPEAPKPKKVAAPKPKKDNSFLKWLGFVKKAPAPQEAPAVAAQPAKQPVNSYLVGFLN